MPFRPCPSGCGRFLSADDRHDRCLQCLGFQHAEDAHNRALLQCLSSRRCMRSWRSRGWPLSRPEAPRLPPPSSLPSTAEWPGGTRAFPRWRERLRCTCAHEMPPLGGTVRVSRPRPVSWQPLSRPKLIALRARQPPPCTPWLSCRFTKPRRSNRCTRVLPTRGWCRSCARRLTSHGAVPREGDVHHGGPGAPSLAQPGRDEGRWQGTLSQRPRWSKGPQGPKSGTHFFKREQFPFPPGSQVHGTTVCDALLPHSRPQPILPVAKRVRFGDDIPPHAPLASPVWDPGSSVRMPQNAPPSVPSTPTPFRCTTTGMSIVPLEPLAQRLEAWLTLPSLSRWLTCTIWLGYAIQFARRPPKFNGVLETSVAIEPVPPAERRQGFYSPYFIIPKKRGGLQPILDLRVLNRALHKLPFKMRTRRHIIKCIQP